MKYLRLVFLPFSFIYFIIISLRNTLYRMNILKSHKIPAFVISVGNIITGGSGKTPLCIILTELFLSLDKKVCIISRGYRRSSKGLIVGFDGVYSEVIENTGDELMMIIDRFSSFTGRFFVLADSNRVRAAYYAVSKFNPDIIILDDAFQHLSIKRDMNLLIRDCDSNEFNDKLLLPAGNMREPAYSIRRADIIIKNYKFSEITKDSTNDSNTINANYISKGLYNKNNLPIQDTNRKYAVVFSGLAKNESFFKYVIKIPGLLVKEAIGYPDHHEYSTCDIDYLISHYEENSIYITTEKDFVKLRKYTDFLNNFEVYYLKIELITDKNRIINTFNSISNI